jgi:hypothetical protein
LAEGLCNTLKDTPLKDLENERNTLLKEIEEQWRQRSRAIWIQSGDLNTIFFIILRVSEGIVNMFGRLLEKRDRYTVVRKILNLLH